MKPQRFCSLKSGRIKPSTHSLFACLGAVVLFCFATNARGAAADDSEVKDSLFKNHDLCQKGLEQRSVSIYRSDGKTLLPDSDPDLNCVVNAGGETQSYNAAAVDQTPKVLRGHAAYTGDQSTVKSQGACRLAYTGLKEIYSYFSLRMSKYCDDFNSAWETAWSCGLPSEARCKPEWTSVISVHQAFATDLDAHLATADSYLDALRQAAQKAHDGYQSDFNRLSPVLQQHRQDPSAAALGASLPDSPDVKASNGNTISQRAEPGKALETYFALLGGAGGAPIPEITGLSKNLLDEEDLAARRVKSFRDDLDYVVPNNKETATRVAETVSKQLEQADLNGSVDPKKKSLVNSDNVDNITKLGSAGAGLAGLTGASKDTPSGSGNDTSGSSGSGSSHDSPVAAMAAAAGLGAAAAHGIDSSSASQAGPAAPNTAQNTPAAPSVSNFGDQGGSGGPTGKASDHGAAGPLNVNMPKADAAAANTTEPGVNPGTAGGAASADAASRSMAAHRAPSSGAGTGAAAEGGGGGAGDAMASSFGTNLDPKPAPKSAASSPGSEVANLLGQMKNLFNFDETNPMGGGPGGPGIPPMIGPPPPMENGAAATVPGMPDAMAADGTAPAADGAEPGVAGAGQAEEVQGSLYGKLDVSLFTRVHARHHRCMERGLVLYGLKERVE